MPDPRAWTSPSSNTSERAPSGAAAVGAGIVVGNRHHLARIGIADPPGEFLAAVAARDPHLGVEAVLSILVGGVDRIQQRRPLAQISPCSSHPTFTIQWMRLPAPCFSMRYARIGSPPGLPGANG
jgi:hypothetical protein